MCADAKASVRQETCPSPSQDTTVLLVVISPYPWVFLFGLASLLRVNESMVLANELTWQQLMYIAHVISACFPSLVPFRASHYYQPKLREYVISFSISFSHKFSVMFLFPIKVLYGLNFHLPFSHGIYSFYENINIDQFIIELNYNYNIIIILKLGIKS